MYLSIFDSLESTPLSLNMRFIKIFYNNIVLKYQVYGICNHNCVKINLKLTY